MATLSKKATRELIAFIEKEGYKRAAVQGRDFNEVDFACGAMAALFGLGVQDRIPARWVFNPMRNKPIFEEVAPSAEQKPV